MSLRRAAHLSSRSAWGQAGVWRLVFRCAKELTVDYRADLSAGRLAQRRFQNALFGPDID
ncbi:hypothetical protein D5039_19000 [Verminephrobacter aporrectodeae subsp. tuberculatae]|uniref:Uncharacterized protein n=1 Tax=Verminephrobacter aporrectodeae subsp. tuberculatae TaxID=1110392 RepID=A0ABT3KYV3_9BURK|nr:hypothetical protein [Verminephrobacter aporrectodeae]MCW5323152.1 hypothetical protein [Verminephrobacter aporrectodeae subsp. tuberculatae]MCW8165206.1 hypothetical protein [Verminephrobacter aporrectodeae subsp. tuberculatae]MCW8167861.1 hypothetical protein [Verminephrobacter aporrectodeae subsp. tuberculatae]